MATEYYFNHLDPTSFQRLINAILVSRFGEAIRLLPLRGRDGGRDAETLPDAPLLEVRPRIPGSIPGPPFHAAKGRYLFQVKHHRTVDVAPSVVRNTVVSEFESEITTHVVPLSTDEKVDFFFLVTNVPASKEAIAKIDEKRRELQKTGVGIFSDVLWGEHVSAWLIKRLRSGPRSPTYLPGGPYRDLALSPTIPSPDSQVP